MSAAASRGSWIAGIGPWAGVGASPAGILVGGGIAASLGGLWASAVAAAIGLVLLGALGIAHGEVGRRMGRAALNVLCGPLGDDGARIAGAVIALMMVGWLGVNAGVAGEGVARLLGVPDPAGIAFFVALMSAVAWRGLVALSWFAVIAATATVGVAGWGMWLARDATPMGTPAAGAEVGVLGAAALVVGFGAAFALRSPDFTRVAADRRQVLGNAVVGLCLPLAAFLAAGMILQRASGQWNLAEVLVALGSGNAAYLLLAVGFSGSVLTNLYSGALAIRLLGGGDYHRALVITALAGGALAIGGLADRLLGFLAVIAAAAASLLVLSIAHHLLGRSRSEGLDRRGLIAWIAGAGVGVVLSGVVPDAALAAAAVVALAIYLPRPRAPGEASST